MTEFAFTEFDLMGTRIRFWIDQNSGHAGSTALASGERFLRNFDRRLSRFRPDSELSALNANPAETVAVSPLMFRFLRSAIDAAERSDGLVDPTLLSAVEAAGYRESRAGVSPLPIAEVLAVGNSAVPAGPNPEAPWKSIKLDRDDRTVTRPPGLMIDSGGSGKGLAADMVAELWQQLLPEGTSYIVDCGGDMRVGPQSAGSAPYEIGVKTSPAPARELKLTLSGGAVATSGIGNRSWLDGEGRVAHHLIDPSTGKPAWTGIASVTAIGDTALQAETIAKTALLSGAPRARTLLAERGGVMVDFDGVVTPLNPTQMAVAA